MLRLHVLVWCIAMMAPALSRAQEGTTDIPTPPPASEPSDSSSVAAPPLVDADTPPAPSPEPSSDPEPASSAHVPIPEPVVETEPEPASEPLGAGASATLEFLGGTVGAVGFGAASLFLVGAPGCEVDTCTFPPTLALGLVLGVPVGVIATGALLDRHGRTMPTLLGYIGGLALAGILFYGLDSMGAEDDSLIPLLAVPLLGAIAGYEISHSYNVPRAAPPPKTLGARGASWMPVAGVTPRGGFVGGLAGRF